MFLADITLLCTDATPSAPNPGTGTSQEDPGVGSQEASNPEVVTASQGSSVAGAVPLTLLQPFKGADLT